VFATLHESIIALYESTKRALLPMYLRVRMRHLCDYKLIWLSLSGSKRRRIDRSDEAEGEAMQSGYSQQFILDSCVLLGFLE
jgi:hypothetical protein